ncbi:hypothetical protein D7Y09_13870 [bacterium 1XD42-1]|nr:hypothetical protein D7X25_14300 [bacterium 1XD42-8]RKJ62399.1 hypothetical protein D7Y09_13870 [bacterium 1XD42-1]
MVDDYLRTFEGMFFNAEKCEPVKLAIDQVGAVLSSIITRYGEIENEISYGTSRQDNFIDTVICLFVRKIMEQLDAINILYSVCSFTQAQVILRSLIENIISMEFILKEDTKKRAAAYSLEHHYQEIEIGDECFSENSKYWKLLLANGREKQLNDGYEGYKKKKAAFERIIKSQEIFQQVDKDRKEKLNQKKQNKGKRKIYIQWYEVCSNISSFYGLMKETGYEQYYQSIYGGLSFETHALNSTMDLSVDESGLSLKYIRNPVGGGSTFALACTFSMGALKALYEYLNDGEEEKREFRAFFLDFQKKRDIATHNLDMIRDTQSSKGG